MQNLYVLLRVSPMILTVVSALGGILSAGQAIAQETVEESQQSAILPGQGTMREMAGTSEQRNASASSSNTAHPLLLAQSTSSQSSNDASGGLSKSGKVGESELQEVVVTAEKRTERVVDVPASLSTISGDRLESLQVQSLSDLAAFTPGLDITTGGSPAYRSITIRGLSTGYAADVTGPLVATYIDDVQIGSSTQTARGNLFGLDLLPFDIDRVEVLNGPQGTLYGSNTMGGLVKYVLKQPDLNDIDGRVGASIEHTEGSGSPGWSVNGAISVPLITSQLGLRVSAFDQTTAGWIDNVGTGQNAANTTTEEGGRAVLLWKPAENVSVTLSALIQDLNTDDTTNVLVNPATQQPVYGWNKTLTHFPEPVNQQARNYSAKLVWDFGFATLTSVSGWSKLRTAFAEDYSSLGAVVPPDYNAYVIYAIDDQLSKFVEEVRLASPENQRLQWLIGGYFTREYGGETSTVPTFTPQYVQLPTNLLITEGQNDIYREKAVFADLTYRLTDQFELGAGIRESGYYQFSCPGFEGGSFGTGTTGACTELPTQDVTTWMGNARFHVTDDAMVYARVATGYRPGQGCPTCTHPGVPEAPNIVKPDKTTNYEVGFKVESSDRRLEFTSAVFDVEWRDIQLEGQDRTTGFVYVTNGGSARSTGLELTGRYVPIEGLTLNSTFDYTDARLTANTPFGVGGLSGDALPISPRWTASLAADYVRPLVGAYSATFGGSYRYRDSVTAEFPGATTAGALPLGPENIVNIYTGVLIGKLSTRLYAKNLFENKSYSGLMFITDTSDIKYVPVQPRTIGVSMDYRF